MNDLDHLLQIRPVGNFEHFSFNLHTFDFFRKSEQGQAILFFGKSKLLTLVISVSYLVGCEIVFHRQKRFFVELNEHVVGVFVLREESEALHVSSLAVAPQYRRCGIAISILNYCVKAARSMGKKWLELSVLKMNVPARQLYEKAGFFKKQERKWSLLMKKRLCTH